MLPERLDEIKRLRAGITPPPWEDANDRVKSPMGTICRIFSMDLVGSAYPNVAFIAASPSIVDDLLAEREELVRVIEVGATRSATCRLALAGKAGAP